MTSQILIVDDDDAMCRLLENGLASGGHTTVKSNSTDAALERFAEGDIDVVITDVRMRGLSGIELCRRVAESRPDVPVIVITAFGSMETAVEAIRAGAYDFITKPFELDRIRLTVQRAVHHRQLHQRLIRLEETRNQQLDFGELIGTSAEMQRVYNLIERVAASDTTVLVSGESGTGKELVARALHLKGPRATEPFVALNCAAMPPQLLESELFGHVRGAFTDARADRSGMFQAAGAGTLFLDEVGEMPLALQPKLLRALQERTIRPVGSNREVKIEARIVAATNRDLETAVRAGTFREDLFYRLNVIEIDIPPLRARGNDLLLLAQHFIERFGSSGGRSVKRITAPAARKLLAYSWPGNVRELQNCIERAVTLTRFSEVTVDDLPDRVVAQGQPPLIPEGPDEFITMDELERRYILRVCDATGGNKSHAAKILGFNRKTLYRKLVRYGVLSDGDLPPDSLDEPVR